MATGPGSEQSGMSVVAKVWLFVQIGRMGIGWIDPNATQLMPKRSNTRPVTDSSVR